MAVGDGRRGIDLHVKIHQYPRAHPPRSKLVQAHHPRETSNSGTEIAEHLSLKRRIGDLANRSNQDRDGHLRDQRRDHHGCRRIEDGKPHPRPCDPRQRRNRGEGVGALVPRVGDHQGTLVPPTDPNRDLEERLLDGDAETGHPERDPGRYHRLPESARGVPGDPHRGAEQDHAEEHRSQRLVASVPVGVILVRGLRRHPKTEQCHYVGREVREAVNRVGHQHAGAAEQPDATLHDDEHQIGDGRQRRHAAERPQAIAGRGIPLALSGSAWPDRLADFDPHLPRSNARQIFRQNPAGSVRFGSEAEIHPLCSRKWV